MALTHPEGGVTGHISQKALSSRWEEGKPNNLKEESQPRTAFSNSLMSDLLFGAFCPKVRDIHSFDIYQASHHFRHWEHNVPVFSSLHPPGVTEANSSPNKCMSVALKGQEEKSCRVTVGCGRSVREDPAVT